MGLRFVLLIFLFLLREGIPVFLQVPLDNLFGTRWYPTFDFFGTLPLILGSLLITFSAIVIALPLGVAAAVFVREVAPNWAREILKPMIEVLAGIPSVVLGFFGINIPLIHESGIVGIGFSLFVIVIAALNLVLDFDFIESGVEQGAPKYMEWYGAFGLMVTLVWLYLELLRLLSKLRR